RLAIVEAEVPMARVTLQTIADEVGVSRMTVSNAFSRPDQLSAELRERVLAAAARLGYSGPDPAARALARGRTGVIGMLLTESPMDAFRDDVAVGFVRAAAGALAAADYSLVLLHTGGEASPTRDLAMDGAIVYACTPQDRGVADLQARRLPIVRVEGASMPGVSGVWIDDETGAAAAARHLVELGHRDVALVVTGLDLDGEPVTSAPPVGLAPIERRLAGWLPPLLDAGARVRVVGTPFHLTDELLRERIERLLEDPPTAVLAYSDLAAVEVLNAAAARGLRVPEDLSVVGFDDNPIAERVRPRLTTVRQDLQRKGEAAVAAVLEQLDGAEPRDAAPIATELVVRESTAAPRT
ncbi:LacI family DNA-binding transcriptional regulator, partial [Agrococcus baldri]|uniref:LacI family DNA-binding transcriptional regulator n=1 Tax=Agrococcus baldri TaxID=153730 RepID=UPI00296E4C3B